MIIILHSYFEICVKFAEDYRNSVLRNFVCNFTQTCVKRYIKLNQFVTTFLSRCVNLKSEKTR